MRFPAHTTILALSIAWAGLLFGVDRATNPRRPAYDVHPPAIQLDRASVGVWIRAPSCRGGSQQLALAISSLPWIRAVREPGGGSPLSTPECAEPSAVQRLEFEIDTKRIDGLDLSALDGILRDLGLAAASIEVGGISHFGIVARLPGACCADPLRRALEDVVTRRRPHGYFGWLDSVRIEPADPGLRVIAYPRMNRSADLTELIEAFEDLGLRPGSLSLELGSDRT